MLAAGYARFLTAADSGTLPEVYTVPHHRLEIYQSPAEAWTVAVSPSWASRACISSNVQSIEKQSCHTNPSQVQGGNIVRRGEGVRVALMHLCAGI